MKWIHGSLVIFALSLANSGMAAPEGVVLRSAQSTGMGCYASGSEMGAALDTDGVVLTLPNMLVEWGPSIEKVRSRIYCILTLDMAVPQGWQYSLKAVEASGYVKLDAGLRAEVTTQYYFAGNIGQRLVQSFQGPADQDFRIRDVPPIGSQVWSDCKTPGKLSIRTVARIQSQTPQTPGAARGFLELGNEWETNTLKLPLSWRRCQP